MSKILNVDQVISGSVRKEPSRIRVAITGVHPSRLETWSQRFDLVTKEDDLLQIEEQTESAIMARMARKSLYCVT